MPMVIGLLVFVVRRPATNRRTQLDLSAVGSIPNAVLMDERLAHWSSDGGRSNPWGLKTAIYLRKPL